MMTRIARRLAGSLLVLLIASLVAFAILDAAPGDAALRLVGDTASQAQLDALRAELGLDQPLLVRYARFIAGALHGDLGMSLINGRPVVQLVGERFGYTFLLAITATLVAVLIGVPVGIFAARRRGSLMDLLVMATMALGISFPSFGLAIFLTGIFSVWLHWLPVVGGGTPAHLVLPAVSLALPMLALVARLSRSGVLDAAQAQYVLTARAKGLPVDYVWRKHILRNGLVPVVTVVGLHFGHLLGGAFVIETLFGWPGLGRLIVQAVFDQDYPVILGAVLLLAGLFLTFNLLIDLLLGVIDPRIGSEGV